MPQPNAAPTYLCHLCHEMVRSDMVGIAGQNPVLRLAESGGTIAG